MCYFTFTVGTANVKQDLQATTAIAFDIVIFFTEALFSSGNTIRCVNLKSFSSGWSYCLERSIDWTVFLPFSHCFPA